MLFTSRGGVLCAVKFFKSNCVCQCSSISKSIMKGLVLGVYCKADNQFELTPSAVKFDKQVSGKLQHYLSVVSPGLKHGAVRVFYDIATSDFSAVALVALREKAKSRDEIECLWTDSEDVRVAASAACRTLQDQGFTNISVEDFEDAQSAVEGAVLGIWKFQEFSSNKTERPAILPYLPSDQDAWNKGCVNAEAQNEARYLTDLPANILTPTEFASKTKTLLSSSGIDIKCYDKGWILEKGMNSFLSVTKGSVEPPVFLEIHYKNGTNEQPVVLVGKGITFDSGGICLKSSSGMDEMRGDMGGAACIVGTLLAASKLKIPLNIVALIPLCENMPSGTATHPGDVVKAMNGKTIQIDNTDAEGRLILADALSYAASFNPSVTVDIATLTGAVGMAIGDAATGVFTNSSIMWKLMSESGEKTGDRVWRFPLFEAYSKKMKDYPAVDVNNLGKGKQAGACKAAAFLKEFAPPGPWIHMDIAGVMGPNDNTPYLHKGMTGRPTRTIIQFLLNFATEQSSK